MKKAIVLFAVIVMTAASAISAGAKSGDAAGSVYSTDIIALINDVPVPSYNIGGKTAIILEDLTEYGAHCFYSDKIRTLVVEMRSWNKPAQKQVDRGVVGKTTGKIYETDIETYVNGLPIQAFALNGKMAVAIEDLCEITREEAEYSPYLMRCVWDAADRTISMYFLYDNFMEIFDILDSRGLSLRFENDKIDIYANPFYKGFGGSYLDGFAPPPSFPLYYHDQRAGTGFRYADVAILYSEDEDVSLSKPGFYHYGHFYDVDAVEYIANGVPVLAPTYEDVLKYYSEELFGTVVDRVDTDVCTFLYVRQGTPHGATEFLVRIAKDGGYRDYAKEFGSVSLYGTKTFDHVKIEKDTVSFGYDAEYAIDLNSGIMYKK